MHQSPDNWVAIGRAVAFCAWAAHAFSAGIKCWHCMIADAVHLSGEQMCPCLACRTTSESIRCLSLLTDS